MLYTAVLTEEEEFVLKQIGNELVVVWPKQDCYYLTDGLKESFKKLLLKNQP